MDKPVVLNWDVVTRNFFFDCTTVEGQVVRSRPRFTPEEAWAALVEEFGAQIAPYSLRTFQAGLQAALAYERGLPPVETFAAHLETSLGKVPCADRPFYYWDCWLLLAKQVRDFLYALP